MPLPLIRAASQDRATGLLEKRPEALQQTPVTVGRDCPDHPQQSLRRQDGKETKADERRRLESAAGKIRMRRLDNVVEAGDLMVKLRADSADKPVAELRHLAKQNRRAWLGPPIHLWKRRKHDIALSHGLRSATVYSGSSSP
jgi:hypothetical protein